MPRQVQNRVLDLIEESGVTLEREACPPWLVRPGRVECGEMWPHVTSAYTALTGLDLPEVMPSRERRSLDAISTDNDGSQRVIEFDEAQHFNPYRAMTFDHYPRSARLAFDQEQWRQRSLASTKLRGGGWGKAKLPLFPDDGGRHRQRAFRDLLADLLPSTHGWLPTLRVAHFEVEEWLHEPDAVRRMGELITRKTG